MADSVKELRDAASTAHGRGDGETAIKLFEKILELFPDTPEASEAVFYLSSIGSGVRRRSPQSAGSSSPEKKEAPRRGLKRPGSQ